MEEREILRLEMWGTVQKSVENDRSHSGMCCIECHVRCKFRLRTEVTYMSLFWPWVSKNASQWKSLSAGEGGHLPSVPQGVVTQSWVLGRAMQ